jgi:hypothetical protein
MSQKGMDMLKELARREQEQWQLNAAHREVKSLRLQAQFQSQVKALQKEKDEQRKRWRRYRA